jgi:hypothetical protein
MASSIVASSSTKPFTLDRTVEQARAASIPWYVWCAILAITSIMIGGHWDISWHESIGRDSFWTPAHMAIYLGGLLCGVAFGYLILHTTFSPDSPLKESSVRVWGFRAPLGAFIASWGGITMLASAPFDNWWHNAYGLDVEIISPPHIVLFVGIYAIILGTMILLAGYLNRVSGSALTETRWLFLYACGVMLTVLMVMLMEFTSRPYLHNAKPYIAMALLAPITIAIGSRVTRMPFAATAVAGIYTLVNIGLILILPLFPAEPKLGPVYQHVTQFVPPQFPILLIVPALALDLIFRRTEGRRPWTIALIGGFAFAALLIAAEWPLASFLLTPASRNYFFGTQYLMYSIPPQSSIARNVFFITWASPAELWLGFLAAGAAAILAIRWAISRGEWMRSVQR